MIVVWEIGIPSARAIEYRHLWTRMAAKHGEMVFSLPYSRFNEQREFNRVNHLNQQRAVFVKPNVIPFPSFFDELDYLREQDQLVVTIPKYTATFELGNDQPIKWEPDGLSQDLVVFQIAGQSNFMLPETRDVWKWLEKSRDGRIYRLPSNYCGSVDRGASVRNNLCEMIYAPFSSGSRTTLGKMITGGQKWYSRDKQFKLWDAGMSGWNIWEKQ